MCTIIKVKRKITEDPVECLIIECKKTKLTHENNKQILKYAGTAVDEDEVPVKIKELSSKLEQSNESTENKQRPKLKAKKINSSTNKTIDKEIEKSQCYVLLNKKRVLEDDENTEKLIENESIGLDKKLKYDNLDRINIIDVISPSNLNETTNNTNKFIYDIYYTNNSNIDLINNVNNYEIKGFNEYDQVELVDDDLDKNEEDICYEDDEDSNDESNWRNDYPDEEDIDDETDHEPTYNINNSNKGIYRYDYNDEDYDDDYNEYTNEYEDNQDDNYDLKLSNYMKKSLAFDNEDESDNNDSDDYDNEDFIKSYASYKKRILKEFEQDYQNVDY